MRSACGAERSRVRRGEALHFSAGRLAMAAESSRFARSQLPILDGLRQQRRRSRPRLGNMPLAKLALGWHLSPRTTSAGNERRTWAAALVNLFAMVVEIHGGTLFHSAALLADGYHMGAHVTAMLVAGIGYRLAAAVRLRRGEAAARWAGDLAGMLNALILVGIAGLLLAESVEHLLHPEPIPFFSATALAVFGLVVNIASLALLHQPHRHEYGRRRDISLHAIYLHMIGDAAVGVLSLFGLCLVAGFRWLWADGVAGVCGGVLIGGLAIQIVAALRATYRSRRQEALV